MSPFPWSCAASRVSSVAVVTYTQKVLTLFGANVIGYWTLQDASGTVCTDVSGLGYNGAYPASPHTPTLGQTGIGDGLTCASFDGTDDCANLYTAGLAGVFDGSKGTVLIWGKVAAAGVWTDATDRYLFDIGADSLNRVYAHRTTANSAVAIAYRANNVTKLVTVTSSSTDWFHCGVTWDKTADKAIMYWAGSQTGTTQTGLGTWAGALATAQVVAGVYSTLYGNPWSGLLAHVLILNRAATPAEVAIVATI
jgi:hypothetical protein